MPVDEQLMCRRTRGATTGVAAAVANAIFHATGVRIRDLPITLDKVLALAPNNESPYVSAAESS